MDWRRKIDICRHPRPELARPVRIDAGALGDNQPVRDLLLSPEHALWLQASWVPARDLINGATIRQEARSHVEYFHVELDSHDILLAEGIPAESYLDCDNRNGFYPAVDLPVAVWAYVFPNRFVVLLAVEVPVTPALDRHSDEPSVHRKVRLEGGVEAALRQLSE